MHSTFVVFDIESFYPSILLELFNKAITFASSKCDITEDELNIIMQSRKTLLFHDNHLWVKKNGEEDFDVPMGCNDEAEICETTGCYILHQLGSIINKNSCGLYRDDGLGSFENLSGPQIESKCKQIIKLFKSFGLNITIKTNLTSVDFLDVRLNLKDGTYEPCSKPNSNPLYIHKNSNHPPSIIRDILKSISKRLSDISCNQEVFEKVVPLYENALERGFDTILQYVQKTSQTEDNTNNKKRRKRNIIWFNPPYSANVKTNIGKVFFKLFNKHFPKNNQLHKVFNKNTVKLSYSCMKNMSSIISAHNKNVLRPSINTYGCNCRVKANCPLNNKCQISRIVYRADVSNNVDTETKFYCGLTDTAFKERYNNHKKSFRHERYRYDSELCKYLWEFYEEGKEYKIEWSIIRKINSSTRFNFCKLCLTEKYFMLNALGDCRLLNKKSEFVNKCRHENKLLLSNIKDSKD